MGSKITMTHKRLKKAEFETLLAQIDKQEFLNFYLENGNEAVCAKYNIGLGPMYRLLKSFKITLTPEQSKTRNKIATSQRVQALYGVDNNFQRIEVQNKIKENLFNNYGVINSFQLETSKLKSKETCLQRYGVENPACSAQVRGETQTTYIFNNTKFDSFPELAVWIYAIDHNIDIVREPVQLKYIFEGQEHSYFPDFRYAGKLIEIKGLHFFKEKNKNLEMVNPYDHTKDGLMEAKHQCGIQNGVEIWTEAEYQFAVDYIKSTYILELSVAATKRSKYVQLKEKEG